MKLPNKTRTEPEFRLVLPSHAENVAIVRQALGGAVEVLELEEARLLDINAAVSEACNNVVVHAYEEGHGPMRVRLCIGDEELEVIVSDEGVGIRPTTPEPQMEVQGLGLSLIQTLTDRVEVLGGVDEGTKVRMAFALDGTTAESWARELPARDWEGDSPPGEMTLAVSVGPLAAPVLGRVLAMLAARAGFSLEGISEAQLVTDALAAHAPNVLIGNQLELGIDRPESELVLRVGPLAEGGGERVLAASALGDLPPVLERLTRTRSVLGSDKGELLCLTLGESG